MIYKALFLGAGLAVATALAGCSSDDNSSPPKPDAGGDATTDAAADATADSAVDAAADGPGLDAGDAADVAADGADAGLTDGGDAGDATTEAGDAGDGAATTLYERLGGHAGIRTAINAIVTAELNEPDIRTYFAPQLMTPVPAGHPNADQLEECFTDFISSQAGGTEVYPTTVTDDAGAWTCRNIVTTHADLYISGGTFDRFVTIAAGVLSAPPFTISASDLTTLADVLNGTKTQIVAPSLADAGELPFDAGGQ